MKQAGSKIAIVIPAYNEELTIQKVMASFHGQLPEARLVVVDNASTDKTYELSVATAKSMPEGSCTIIQEFRRGKASAVKRAFHDIDADIYVMVDADCTYPASDLPALLQPVLDGQADMVVGNRHAGGAYSKENKRRFHDWGNRLVMRIINILFHGHLQDILSGYRVMTRDFVRNYPILSKGFAIETEVSIHALDKGFRVIELPTHYQDRPEGSCSKLNTISDGIRIIWLIFNIFVNYKPLPFFSIVALFLLACGLMSGAVPVTEFIQASYITHLPLALLAVGLVVSAILSFFTGIILNNSYRSQRFFYEILINRDNAYHN